MNVLLFHPALLPPKDYGGTERVVLWLAKGLIERGHRVWVGCGSGSQLSAPIEAIEFAPGEASAWHLLKRLPKNVDVVHFMSPPEAGVIEQLPCAHVVTIHGQGKVGEVFPKNSIFISRNHAQRNKSTVFVYNGLDPTEYQFNPRADRSGFLFLSKTSWSVKNLKGAIRYASRANASLLIAGGNGPFSQRLKTVFSPRIQWAGTVNGKRKAELLADARALVFPVTWPEPFGLVVIEALVSGTPVLANARGSLPELVTPDVGAILTSDDAWVEKLKEKEWKWSPEACRDRVFEKFHYSKMAESYESFYKKAITGAVLNEESPTAGDWRQQQ